MKSENNFILKHRFVGIDILRIIGVLLVVYAHIVGAGTWAMSLPYIIKNDTSLPVIMADHWQAYSFANFLFNNFSVEPGPLGVGIFFLVTGYLMPLMMERYSRKDFLINRFFRIYPVLAISIFLIGIFLYCMQDISFGVSSYFGSLSLSYSYIKVIPIIGVLWTLTVELQFYIISALIGRLNFYKLIVLQVLLLLIILLTSKFSDFYFLKVLASDSRFLLMITIGSAIYLSESTQANFFVKISYVCIAVVLTLAGFELYKFTYSIPSTYTYGSVSTVVIVLVLVISLLYVQKWIARLPNTVKLLSECVYPLYLLHLPIGLILMVYVRDSLIGGAYFIVFSSMIVVIILSYLVHVFIEKPMIILGKKFTNSML